MPALLIPTACRRSFQIDAADWRKRVTVQIGSTTASFAICDYTWRSSNAQRWPYVITKVQRNGRKKCFLLHRLIMDAAPDQFVDHINGDTFDNRRSNLRFATNAQNLANMTVRPKGRSRFKGVYWSKPHSKWKAQIGHNNRRIAIGYFLTETEAALAYNAKAVELFGEFARLNPITPELAQ